MRRGDWAGLCLGGIGGGLPLARLLVRPQETGRRAGELLRGREASGPVQCWGGDSAGQSSPPGGSFVHVAAGYLHSCGVRQGGDLACWGSDGDGQASPPAGAYSLVSAGQEHSCAVHTGGDIECWGGIYTTPSGSFVGVSSGYGESCGVLDDAGHDCWN